MQQITEPMVEQWVDHPATQALKTWLTERIERFTDAFPNCYAPGEPNKTQERMCSLHAQIIECVFLRDNLDKDGFLSEVVPDEQLQRDNADRLQSLN